MAEITDYPFRTIAKEFGVGLTFTQMVSAEGIIRNDFNTLRMLTFSRAEKPIGVQLLGNNPKILGQAVKELVRYKPNLIDLNCGCPVSKVYQNKMGSYLLSQPKKLAELVKEMVENSEGIPISLKLRLGYAEQVNVIENAKIIEDNGASLITVHARTRLQRYDEKPDWKWIKKLKETVKIPIFGNGGIFTANDALEVLEKTNCDGLLIARGALGNPFIFKEINYLKRGKVYNPLLTEIKDTVLKHIDLLEREQSLSISLDRAKKNIIWYFKYQNGIEKLIDNLYVSDSFNMLRDIVEKHVINIQHDIYPKIDKEKIKKKFNNRVLFWLAKKEVKV